MTHDPNQLLLELGPLSCLLSQLLRDLVELGILERDRCLIRCHSEKQNLLLGREMTI